MPTPFTGTLNANEIFSALYNMIISQQVFADNIKGTYGSLASRFKTDGTLYGDTKIYYATDCLKSQPWGNDAEAVNLLQLHRPAAPAQQKITIDQFRMIPLTVDNYLSKRAWSTEGAFSSFNSVMLGWMGETKKIYESTLINAYVGTTVSSSTINTINIDVDANGSSVGQNVAEGLANLLVDLQDVRRDYNEYGYIRSYDPSDFLIAFNSKYANRIKNIDMPVIFDNAGLEDYKMEKIILPERFFGTVGTTQVTAGNNDGTKRSLVEKDYTVSGTTTHVFPGDLIPSGVAIAANEYYTPATDIIAKVIHKSSVPFMSAFEVGTNFFNPRSLTETHYSIWGYSKPDYLKNYPFLTVKAV